MRRALLRLSATGAVLAALLGGATAAVAVTPPAATGTIASVRNADGVLDVAFQANGLPEGTKVDLGSVTLSVDGTLLPTKVTSRDSGPQVQDSTAVLAIDISRSMTARGVAQAQVAAKTFLAGVDPTVNVGLVTFASRVFDVVVPPTTNRARLETEIDGLRLAPRLGTALYDAAVRATEVAGVVGVRNVLLMTDGEESGASRRTLQGATAIIDASGVVVNGVYFGGPGEAGAAKLEAFVAGVGGTVVSAQDEELAAAFGDIARTIDEQVQIRAVVPAELAGETVTVKVSASAGDARLSDRTATTFTDAVAVPPGTYGPRHVEVPAWKTWVSEDMLPLALGVLFLGLLIVVAFALNSTNRRDEKRGRVRRRLSIYTLTGRTPTQRDEPATTALGSSHIARSAVELAGKVVQKRDFEGALSQRLEAGSVPLRPAEWMLIHVGVAVGSALLLLLISGGALPPALIGLGIGLAAPWVYLSLKESRRKSAFLAQLPDTLQLLAGSVSAGYSMPQALDTVVREGQQPMTGEFNRALVEARLGVPIEDALDGVAERMRSKDFSWVVMAIKIQREVGGNLAELLTTVSATMRERERLRRQVQVLSAEGRLSAWILGLLPIVFAIYLLMVRPAYLEPLYTEPLGILMLGGGIILLTVGVLWMRKSVKVEV